MNDSMLILHENSSYNSRCFQGKMMIEINKYNDVNFDYKCKKLAKNRYHYYGKFLSCNTLD